MDKTCGVSVFRCRRRRCLRRLLAAPLKLCLNGSYRPATVAAMRRKAAAAAAIHLDL